MANIVRRYKGMVEICLIFFVVFTTLFFCKQYSCLASYSENFDSDPENTGMETATHATAWSWSIPATTNFLFKSTSTQSHSAPYSVRNLVQGGSSSVYATSTTGNKTNFSVWTYVPSSNANSYIYLYFLDEDLHYIGAMKITAGGNSLIWYKDFSALTNPISLNQYITDSNWHKHEFAYNKDTGLMTYSLDNGFYSTTTLPFGQYSSIGKAMRGFGFNNPSVGITPAYSVFLDDISFYGDNDLPPSVDYVAFLKPLYEQDYTVYNFSWNLLYQISTTSIATYPYALPGVAVEWKNIDTGVIGRSTTTGVAWLGDTFFNSIVHDATYNFELTNRIFTPQQLGTYIATATLFAWEDIDNSFVLKTSTTTWTMSTGTPENITSGWCKNLCWDMSSSTSLLDSLTNSITCGGRYVMCYTFQPHDSILDILESGANSIKDCFPFNSFFQLTDTVKDTLASSTNALNDTGTIGAPFIRKTATNTEFYMITVLDKNTIPNAVGQTNATMIRTTLGWVSWLFVAGLISLMVFTF